VEEGYLDLDVSVEDRLYRRAESAERKLIEEGVRPEQYTSSLLAVAADPGRLPEAVLKQNVWVGVEGVNPEVGMDENPEIDEEYSFYWGVGSETGDDDVLDLLLDALQEDATIISSTREWYSNDIVASLNEFGQYEELLWEASREYRTTETESVEFFVKSQSEAPELKQAVELLEGNGHIGLKLFQQDSGEVILIYEEDDQTGCFREVEDISRKYESSL